MNWVSVGLVALCLASMVGCSGARAYSPATIPVATDAASTAVSTASSASVPSGKQAAQVLPRCKAMQELSDPVNFDWPNLDEHKQEFSRSEWNYYSCEQPASEVASLYRQRLTNAPYGMEETNWLVIPEGTLGVYFSQKGSWDYIWFISRPGDPQKSYVISAETFAYVECF